MKRILVAVASMGAVALAPFANPVASAESADAAITKLGWWTRNPAASAPDDGFNVSRTVDGPISIAAIEIASAAALESAVIVIAEDGGVQQDSAALEVCITPNQWVAGSAQDWGSAPKPECASGSVPMTRNAPSASWGADVTSLVRGIDDDGRVSLMIVPDADSGVAVGFEVRFKKPELHATAAPPPSSVSTASSSETSTQNSNVATGTSADDPSTTESPAAIERVEASPFETASAPVDVPQTVASDAASGVEGASSPDTTGGTDELASLPSAEAAGVAAATTTGNHTLQALFFVLVATLAGVGAGVGRWFVRRRSEGALFA